MDNDDMAFQCNYQMTILNDIQQLMYVEEWLPCNDMDNIDKVV